MNSTAPIIINRSHTLHPLNFDFRLHTHTDMLEILIFISGDSEFRVEGNVYPLHPYDAVVVASNEMHRVFHHSDTPYERIVINLPDSFFVTNSCEEYSDLFFGRKPGDMNLIPHEITKNTGYSDCIHRLLKYQENGESPILVKSILIELLHLLNKSHKDIHRERSYSNQGNKHIREVISYINDNLTENINLDTISEKFFINKNYLCRAFKRHTGYTLNKYITHKRILYVRELCARNMSLTQASLEAGFGDYSNFYKMYVKETGHAPSKDLRG